MQSIPTPSVVSRRAECAQCLRAQRSCICHWVRRIDPLHQVLVLQHPLEIRQAKGSGRLLHLSLTGSRLACGEQFDEASLHALLYGAWAEAQAAPLLLYPAADALATGEVADMSVPQMTLATRRLVILDATWRKSRKMLYLNPLLQQLPRLSLQDPPASHYRIRKAHRPDQLSTLEATCHALGQLEQDGERYLPLLQAFDGFVAQQAAYAGRTPHSL